MAFQNQHYQTLLALIAGIHYTDFSTLLYDDLIEALKQAGVTYETEAYMLDIYPYTTPGMDIKFELAQVTGHRNRIRLTFIADEKLQEVHIHTSL